MPCDLLEASKLTSGALRLRSLIALGALGLVGPIICSCGLPGGRVDSVSGSPVPRSASLPTVTPVVVAASDKADRQAAGTPVPQTLLPTQTSPATPTFVPTPPTLPARAEVIYSGVEGLNLRAAPNQARIAALRKGSALTVRGAAQDQGGFRWWPVDVAAGWIADGPSDQRQPRWLAASDGRPIAAGSSVHVTYAGPDGVNLRQAPNPASRVVAALLQGSTATVSGAARTFNGVTWWPVTIAPGWISEGATDLSQPRWLRLAGR